MKNNSLDILKSHIFRLIKEELEDGEEGNQSAQYVNYDVVLIPENVDKAIEALSNVKNYGAYSQHLRDPKKILQAFGPTTPATKGRVAKETWDSFSETEKRNKVADIKSRAPQDFEKVESQLQKLYQSWSEENEGDFIDFLVSLTADKLPMDFYGKYGANFFLTKTPENLAKYSGVMSKGVHYTADKDELVFPQNLNPFKTKDYLKKVLKTIMETAGIQYVFSEQESEDKPKEKAASVTSPDKPNQINFVKTFTNEDGEPDDKLAAKFRKLIPDEFKFKTKVENGKVTVSDITAAEKKNFINASIKFQEKYSNLYENTIPMNTLTKTQIITLIKEVLDEKKLTAAEKKKKEEIVKAMVKKGAPKNSKTYAIATAKAEKVAESRLAELIREALQGYSKYTGKTQGGTSADFMKILTAIAKGEKSQVDRGNDVLDKANPNNVAKILRGEKPVYESSNPTDTVTLDIPLFIRMLEYAREDAQSDMDLHDVTEKATALSAEGKTLTMNDYNNIVGKND